MKKVTLFYFLVIVFLSSGVLSAQFYVKIGGGYNLDFNSINIATSTIISNSGVYSYKAVIGSFGRGPNISGALGYSISSYLAGELGLVYKLPIEFEANLQATSLYSAKNIITGSFLGFAPTFVINVPLDNVKPFMKIGLLVALPATEYEIVDSEGNTEKGIFGGGVDFGLTGGAGILVPISTVINITAEFDFVSFTWKPDEIEVTDSEGMTETIKLEDEWTSNDENRSGPSFIPFSNVGLNIGIQIGF